MVLTISFVFFTTGTKGQNITATADRDKILIGEQLTLQLKAENIDTRTSFLQGWFDLPDTTSHLQVVRRDNIDTVEIGGLTTYLQKITVTSFDSGKWSLPPLAVVLQNRTTGKQTLLRTDSISLEVLPVDVTDLKNYHDVKDIIAVQATPDYTLYIAIAASVILLSVLLWLFVKNSRGKKQTVTRPAYKGTPLQHALEQIEELRREDLTGKQQVKLFYTRLSEICRGYFNEQLQVHSSQATSDELMILLQPYLRDEKPRTAFYQFLRLADVVKFAKYLPAAQQNDLAIGTATSTLKHIDAITQRKEEHAQ